MEITLFEKTQSNDWDEFCKQCDQTTFLHTRSYLAYHENRFKDRSLVISADKRIVGIFVSAESPVDSSLIISHPGLTYGGILHGGYLRGEKMIETLELLMKFYKSLGYKKILYKAVPIIYQAIPSADDIYALFRIGATKYRCDLSSAIKLTRRRTLPSRRVRALKKGKKSKLTIVNSLSYLCNFWAILEKNLFDKYGAKPTHTLQEMQHLASVFPEQISGIFALEGEVVVAGVILYRSNICLHAQYISSNERGNNSAALDLIFESCIELANSEGREWFDFGISNEADGRILNSGLYQFKSEFGGGGVAHEFYEINL